MKNPMVDDKVYEVLKKIDTNKILKDDIEMFMHKLVYEYGIFKTEKDFKLFVLDMMSAMLQNGSIDFPIRYYEKNEKIKKEDKYCKANGDMLTDKYIKENM